MWVRKRAVQSGNNKKKIDVYRGQDRLKERDCSKAAGASIMLQEVPSFFWSTIGDADWLPACLVQLSYSTVVIIIIGGHICMHHIHQFSSLNSHTQNERETVWQTCHFVGMAEKSRCRLSLELIVPNGARQQHWQQVTEKVPTEWSEVNCTAHSTEVGNQRENRERKERNKKLPPLLLRELRSQINQSKLLLLLMLMLMPQILFSR